MPSKIAPRLVGFSTFVLINKLALESVVLNNNPAGRSDVILFCRRDQVACAAEVFMLGPPSSDQVDKSCDPNFMYTVPYKIEDIVYDSQKENDR